MDSTNTQTSKSSTGTAAFSEDTLPPGSAAPAAARRRRPWIAAFVGGAVATVAAGALVACGPGPGPGQGPAPAVTAGSEAVPSASAPRAAAASSAAPVSPSVRPTASLSVPTVQPSASPGVQPPAGAVSGTTNGRYVSASAGASFALPDGWTVEESAARTAGSPGTSIVVFNEARMQVAELNHGRAGGAGGACGPGPYPMTELDTAPVLDNPWATAAGVRFSYRVLDMQADGGAFDYQIGLVDNVSGQLQDSCLMSSFVAGAPRGPLSFADRASQSPRHDDPIFNSMAEAKAYLLTPEYRKLKAMILSLEMQN
ncbi:MULTISPECIES: hypothetical protein [unclassified Arthrobacter]|uniref:hypothetical protein n=1 Tax=unclassified Arthrobacter TaxID=235627 RepID=UPI002DFABB47|nr:MULTISPECIES: hypothetical protein [unclassified Arthrobacter]MEC5192282.1 hypothetical protein [Arthrobacter sp. MP_M4]MEC5203817.1 hypothetical protein [Arthrobacter sp. MP_M7]